MKVTALALAKDCGKQEVLGHSKQFTHRDLKIIAVEFKPDKTHAPMKLSCIKLHDVLIQKKWTEANINNVSFNVVTAQVIQMQVFTDVVKVKVKFSLERAMKAQKGSRGVPLLFL